MYNRIFRFPKLSVTLLSYGIIADIESLDLLSLAKDTASTTPIGERAFDLHVLSCLDLAYSPYVTVGILSLAFLISSTRTSAIGPYILIAIG